VKADVVGEFAASNEMAGNEKDRIVIDGSEVSRRRVTNDATWRDFGVPYRMTDENLEVRSSAALTLEPGVEIVLGAGLGIPVEGELIAAGAEDNRITFRGEESNAGYWQSIRVTPGNSEFRHVDIRHAGDGQARGSLVFESGGSGSRTFENVSIENGEGTCLFAEAGTVLSPCTNIQVSGCAEEASYGGTAMSLSDFTMDACQTP
jgi:hypothetical protein